MMTPQRMLQAFGVHPHGYSPAFTQTRLEPKWVKISDGKIWMKDITVPGIVAGNFQLPGTESPRMR